MSGKADRSSLPSVCKRAFQPEMPAQGTRARLRILNFSSFRHIQPEYALRFAGVAESDPSSPPIREDLLAKLTELRVQSRRYIGELKRINEEVERLQERLSDLSPEARARGGNAAGYPKEQHGAA
jgi:hypothetical protein